MSGHESPAAGTFGCGVCWPESAPDAYEASRGLEIVDMLVDESHYILQTRRCRACGQAYVHVFTERIDWVDGDDPCTRSRMPVTAAEVFQLRASPTEATVAALAPQRRYLFYVWEKGAAPEMRWMTRLSVPMHD